MADTTFTADPTRLMVAAAVGIVVLLVLIIKMKLHPVLSMMISAILIGIGAGMPLSMISETVEKGVGETLQGIALLVGLGSMFGGILESSGGARVVAQTLINRFGQKKAGAALAITGLVIGTTVFFEAGVVVLIPLVFSVAKQTRKSTLYYAIPLLAGLASGYAFVPPSAASVLVSDALGVNLGTMILLGVPTAILSMTTAGIIWGRFIGNKIFTELPQNVKEIHDEKEETLPSFGLVLGVILVPLDLDSLQHTCRIHTFSTRSERWIEIFRRTFSGTYDSYFILYVFSWNTERNVQKSVEADTGALFAPGWHDSSGDCQRWCYPLDASGFRPGKCDWTYAGEQ